MCGKDHMCFSDRKKSNVISMASFSGIFSSLSNGIQRYKVLINL